MPCDRSSTVLTFSGDAEAGQKERRGRKEERKNAIIMQFCCDVSENIKAHTAEKSTDDDKSNCAVNNDHFRSID